MADVSKNNTHSIPIEDKHFIELNPLDAGWEKCVPGHSFGNAIREYYLIHYVFSGEGIFRNESGEYHITSGSCFIIRPGEVTFYKALETNPWHYAWIGFNGTLATLFDNSDDVIKSDVSDVFKEISDSINIKSMREEFLTAQLYLLVCRIFKRNENTARYSQLAANYIDTNYMLPLKVEQIADNLCINRRYLSRMFKDDYGVTLKEYITKVKMTHAHKLITSGYSVYQTAEMTGYNDVFNFSKMFKKYYGISPQFIKDC